MVRANRFIALTVGVWLKLRESIPKLSTDGFEIALTDRKGVQNKQFNDKTYVGFYNTYYRNGTECTSYINLNTEEWESLVAILHEMDDIFMPKYVLPCPKCEPIMTAVPITADGRVAETKLSPERLLLVEANNEIAYNQLMCLCTFCGANHMEEDSPCGFCHKFSCRFCEPQNFCKACNKLNFIPVF